MEEKNRECDILVQRIKELENAREIRAEETNKLESFCWRNNFRIVGIPVSDQEDCDGLVKEVFFTIRQRS